MPKIDKSKPKKKSNSGNKLTDSKQLTKALATQSKSKSWFDFFEVVKIEPLEVHAHTYFDYPVTKKG